MKLLRSTKEGREETPIDLRRVLEAKAPDLKLQADDIYICANPAKSATLRGLEAIVQTARRGNLPRLRDASASHHDGGGLPNNHAFVRNNTSM